MWCSQYCVCTASQRCVMCPGGGTPARAVSVLTTTPGLCACHCRRSEYTAVVVAALWTPALPDASQHSTIHIPIKQCWNYGTRKVMNCQLEKASECQRFVLLVCRIGLCRRICSKQCTGIFVLLLLIEQSERIKPAYDIIFLFVPFILTDSPTLERGWAIRRPCNIRSC